MTFATFFVQKWARNPEFDDVITMQGPVPMGLQRAARGLHGSVDSYKRHECLPSLAYPGQSLMYLLCIYCVFTMYVLSSRVSALAYSDRIHYELPGPLR